MATLSQLDQVILGEIHNLSVIEILSINYLKAKVILGEERELAGTLLSIDGTEGVMKTDAGTIRMLPINYLCKAGN